MILIIAGRINAISTSKIKKIIVIKKNRKENGIREDDFWSNPHSKEEFLSRSNNDSFDKNRHRAIIKFESNNTISSEIEIALINYLIIRIINGFKHFSLS